jgi:hypothetical protein
MFLSNALIFTGAIELTIAQEAYFATLTVADWFFSLSIATLGLIGAITLFLLRRQAVMFFSYALILNLITITYNFLNLSMRTTWREAMDGATLLAMWGGLGILVIITLYARSLAKRGILF